MEKLERFYHPVLFKVVLILAIVWNTGFIPAFFRSLPEFTVKDNQSREEMMKVTFKLNCFVEKKAENIKKRIAEEGYVYTPSDYFHDLEEIEGMNQIGNLDSSTLLAIHYLMAFLDDGLRKNKFTYGDIDKASAEYKSRLQEKTSDIYREEFMSEMKESGWEVFSSWLIGFYFWNLLPVALLYLVWMLEDQERKRWEKEIIYFQFPNPIRFLWTVAAHPFYLTGIFIKFWRRKSHELAVEAEYRRTKSKLFSYLTENEKKMIRDFAESGMAIFSWKQLLIIQGLKPIHSFAAALVITLLFVALPHPNEAKSINDCDRTSAYCQKIGNHLPRISIDDGQNSSVPDMTGADRRYSLKEIFNQDYFSKISRLVEFLYKFRFQEVWRKIAHVPDCEAV